MGGCRREEPLRSANGAHLIATRLNLRGTRFAYMCGDRASDGSDQMSLKAPQGFCRVVGSIALIVVLTGGTCGAQQQQPLRVSLVQLIATPERYVGKQVSVVGFLVFGFEGDWLWLHKEDYDNGINANGVRVERTKDMARDLEKLHRNYVHVVGVFRQEAGLSGFASQGHIVDVQKCELWSQPEHPRAQRFREMQGEQLRQKK